MQVSADTAEDVVNLLHKGNKHRRTESTRCNRTSSRSHALLQIKIVRREDNRTLTGKLSLVDLAGSERTIANERKSSSRSVEGANINKSLLSLSSCIRALVEGKKHIPFRNSKLTQMLKDSLGGMCQTAMIATVTPSSFSLGETANTLHWAERAKMIKLPGARTRHEHIVTSHPLPPIKEKPSSSRLAGASAATNKAKAKSASPPQRVRKLQSLQNKHDELANKLAKIGGNTRLSRKRSEPPLAPQKPKQSHEDSKAEALIRVLEHEVKRLRQENQKQRTDFEAKINKMQKAHEVELSERLGEKENIIQSLRLASKVAKASIETGTQCPAQCKSTANQAMTPVFKAFMEEKMQDKENSSPHIPRLELPMTPRH